jgi:hypothetical protein
MNFEKTFNDCEGIIDWVNHLIAAKISLAFTLQPTVLYGTPQEPNNHSELTSDIVSSYGITGRDRREWAIIYDDFFQAILTVEASRLMLNFENTSHRPENSPNNGKIITSTILPTKTEGVELQIISQEEWWQAFGGAHARCGSRFILVNHDPLKLVSVL